MKKRLHRNMLRPRAERHLTQWTFPRCMKHQLTGSCLLLYSSLQPSLTPRLPPLVLGEQKTQKPNPAQRTVLTCLKMHPWAQVSGNWRTWVTPCHLRPQSHYPKRNLCQVTQLTVKRTCALCRLIASNSTKDIWTMLFEIVYCSA